LRVLKRTSSLSGVKRFCQSSISHLFHSIASFSCFTQLPPPPPTLSSSLSEISSIFSSSCASYPPDRSEVNGKPVRENSGGGDWGGSSDDRSRAEGLTGSVSGGDGLNTNGPENQCPSVWWERTESHSEPRHLRCPVSSNDSLPCSQCGVGLHQ